jgi:uncharacterized protein (TIGR02996 family)
MSDEKALLAAITAHPLDDAPRLVFADWLDERGGKGNAARAEFIRVQCERELLPPSDPRYPALEKREKSLLKAWKARWLAPLGKRKPDVEFSRGFPVPALKNRTVNGLAGLTESDLAAAPLWRYHYTVYRDDLDTVLGWPLLHRIATLHLGGPQKAGWAEQIAVCGGLRNVTDLALNHVPLKPTDLKTVLDAWTGRRLRSLLVNNCPVGDEGITLIATHPATANLHSLYAHTAKITGRGMEAVAAGPNLDRLHLATFAHNRLGATGGRHLLRWKALAGIRELYLMHTRMSEAVRDEFHARLDDRVKL